MSELFGAGASTGTATQGNPNPAPVETEQQSGGASEQAATSERTFTAQEVEKIVKDRLTREQKKFSKQLEEVSAVKKPSSGNVEEDLRNKVSQYEQTNKAMSERLAKLRDGQLRTL